MRKRPHRLDAVKQAHVDAVTAAAGGSHSDSAAALADLRRLLPRLTVLPSSALTFDVDAESKQEDQRVLLGERASAHRGEPAVDGWVGEGQRDKGTRPPHADAQSDSTDSPAPVLTAQIHLFLLNASGKGNYAEVFAGSVKMGEEEEARPCAVKRLSVDKGQRAERLLQEALTMIKCQDEEQPLLLAVALGDGHYDLVRG
jgi:hypothetical protein